MYLLFPSDTRNNSNHHVDCSVKIFFSYSSLTENYIIHSIDTKRRALINKYQILSILNPVVFLSNLNYYVNQSHITYD